MSACLLTDAINAGLRIGGTYQLALCGLRASYTQPTRNLDLHECLHTMLSPYEGDGARNHPAGPAGR